MHCVKSSMHDVAAQLHFLARAFVSCCCPPTAPPARLPDLLQIGVFTNADTPADAAIARKNGAQGIGLVRTGALCATLLCGTHALHMQRSLPLHVCMRAPPARPLPIPANHPSRNAAEHMFFATAERIAAVRRMIAAEELMEEVGVALLAAVLGGAHCCLQLACTAPLRRRRSASGTGVNQGLVPPGAGHQRRGRAGCAQGVPAGGL